MQKKIYTNAKTLDAVQQFDFQTSFFFHPRTKIYFFFDRGVREKRLENFAT
jgi:hypothetical protein